MYNLQFIVQITIWCTTYNLSYNLHFNAVLFDLIAISCSRSSMIFLSYLARVQYCSMRKLLIYKLLLKLLNNWRNIYSGYYAYGIRNFLISYQKFSHLIRNFLMNQKIFDSILYRHFTVNRNPRARQWGNQKISDKIRKFLIAMGFLIPFLITIMFQNTYKI